ncbi:hypothetical protein GCM10027515_18680 [Schumannella luteola]|uniref:ADP-dependent phosphofructokinase/glucokinase n=1 Tax=Schumannella luteola TaxID=472059 RepID=A0A852YBK0_9MICO|nr:ADP-dependent glucokinase/phosphofructokinase [Schumannella luteola]NYH00337.1 ADP-dependent phosphofructokinase/glucokinase [Schumannella luteola]TPX05977.1 hypothetical protein FJ656_03695 [Schumannella luteola]
MTHPLVLGLGGTVDYEIVWDAGVLERLAREHAVTGEEIAAELRARRPIRTERDLLVSVLAFLGSGAGGERFVESSAAVLDFAAHFETVVTLGGTGVRAGLAMAGLGIPSTQHLVSIDDNVRRLLPPEIDWICSAEHDSLDPHLIVQFPAGARVRVGDADGDAEIVAQHPNRLIYSNDPPNRELRLSRDLGDALRGASLFLVSGFNSMQDEGELDARLDELVVALDRLPAEALVLYEDAGFHVPAMSSRVRSRLAGRAAVHGMNEDELQDYLGRPIDLLDAAKVALALDDVRSAVVAPVVLVHTKYWAAAVGPEASRFADALDGGVTMAATRFRLGDGITPERYAATQQLERHARGAEFARAFAALPPSRAGEERVAVPAFHLAVENPTTIGLGDTFVGGVIAALAR